MKNSKHNMLQIAYLYYYATDVAFKDGAETDGLLDERLRDLIGDALIIASQCKFDVFNALTLMDNTRFLSPLKVSSLVFLSYMHSRIRCYFSLVKVMDISSSTCTIGEQVR